jgi:hypothetical protein
MAGHSNHLFKPIIQVRKGSSAIPDYDFERGLQYLIFKMVFSTSISGSSSLELFRLLLQIYRVSQESYPISPGDPAKHSET